MVAVIHASSSLNRALNYNEQKVKIGQAKCLMAANYPKAAGQLTFHQKLNRLKNLAALNQRTKVNSVHISLNFDPKEKLSDDTLKSIAETYISKIGFGQQPYLLYEHLDAGHPHLHVVTTNIKTDGKRIELHNLGMNQSEKARKEIEVQFNLIRASNKKQEYDFKPRSILKIQYGKAETKRAITNVLDAVLNTYKYASLSELNVVLKLYNVAADRGTEDSRTFQKNGLLYRILDEQRNKVGIPIKASLIYNKPNLKFLQEKFEINKAAKQIYKERIKNIIDRTLLQYKNASLQEIITRLKKESIHTELRQNKDGLIYGVTYVDLLTKCVFNGSDLGKSYSAKALQERCGLKEPKPDQLVKEYLQHEPTFASSKENEFSKVLDIIIDPASNNNYVPFPLRRTKKKKKKRLLM